MAEGGEAMELASFNRSGGIEDEEVNTPVTDMITPVHYSGRGDIRQETVRTAAGRRSVRREPRTDTPVIQPQVCGPISRYTTVPVISDGGQIEMTRLRPPQYVRRGIDDPGVSTSSITETININPSHPWDNLGERHPNESLTPLPPQWYNFTYTAGLYFRNICLAMWESYMMVFLTLVLEMDIVFGIMILKTGLVVNVAATFIVKRLKTTAIKKHYIGFILVFVSFVPLFTPYPGYQHRNYYAFPWYITYTVIFQVGCAFMELSHIFETPFVENSHKLLSARLYSECVSKGSSYLFVMAAFVIVNRFYPNVNNSTVILDNKYAFTVAAMFITIAGVISFAIFRVMVHKFTEQERADVNFIHNATYGLKRLNTCLRFSDAHLIYTWMYAIVRGLSLTITIHLPMWIAERETESKLIAIEKLKNPIILPEKRHPMQIGSNFGVKTTFRPYPIPPPPNNMSPLLTVDGSGVVYDMFIIPLLLCCSAIIGGFIFYRIRVQLTDNRIYCLGLAMTALIGFYAMGVVEHTISNAHLYLPSILYGISLSICVFASAHLFYNILEPCHDETTPKTAFDQPVRYGCQMVGFTSISLLFWLCTYLKNCSPIHRILVNVISTSVSLTCLVAALLIPVFFTVRRPRPQIE